MQLNSTVRNDHAFNRVDLIATIGLVLIVAVLTVRHLSGKHSAARDKAERIKCAGNHKQIGLAFKVFANDHDDKFPYLVTNSLGYGNVTQAWLHFQAMSNECGSAKILVCPSDRERWNILMSDFGLGPTATATSLSSKSNRAVSYTIGLGADETQPNAILASDRHVEVTPFNLEGRLFRFITNGSQVVNWSAAQHNGAGNIALSDGSVQQVTSGGLAEQARQQSLAGVTNRLLLPLLP